MAHRLAGSISTAAAGIASLLGPRVMRIIARLNKFVTNPVQRLWAPRVPFMAVIEHRGRRSGRGYRTPVMAFVRDGVICVVLNYGAESDWVRNVLAAGSAGVAHRGARFTLIDPHILPVDAADLPPEVKSVGDSSRKVLRAALHAA